MGEIARAALASPEFARRALGDSDPSVTMSRLTQASSVVEVLRELVEERVSDLMHKSMTDWMSWYDTTFGLTSRNHLPDRGSVQ